MSCTPEEIEKKRQLALAKLQARKLQSAAKNSSPVVNFNLEKSPVNNYATPRSNNNFQPKAASSMSNKVHHSTTPYSKHQIKTTQFFPQTVNGTCALINDSRFELNIGYNAQVIAVCKTIPSSSYSPVNKLWNFSLADYVNLMSKLKTLQPEVVVEGIPKYVITLCRAPKVDNSQIDLGKIEPELLNTLMPFQEDGVKFGIRNNGRCLIADDMGLGKTFQAIALASYYREDWPVLIVTTSSMRNTWESTIHKYLPSVPLANTRYMTSTKDYINDAEILIVSYDLMTRCTEKLTERRFGFLIMDESHAIKNFKAKCTKSALTLAKIAKRVVLLSGTPALSRPNELYSQLSVIDEKFFGNFFEYSRRYCDGKTTHFGWDSSGQSNLTELEIILSRKFMIRRTKSDVLKELPNKSREIIKLDVALHRLSEKERLCLNALVDNYVEKKAQEKHSALLSLFAESAKIKIPAICLYIEKILKENKKFLVFAHHQVMLDAICKVLNTHKKQYIRIDGSTTSDQRKYFIDKFQLKDSCIAAVLSITAANSGITLTAANLVLFAELHWNPSILLQAESRAHRIGQEEEVTVQYLLAHGTVDDHIWPLLQVKLNVLNEVGLCKDSFKDTTVSDQIVSPDSNLTKSGTRSIRDFLQKIEVDKTDEQQMETAEFESGNIQNNTEVGHQEERKNGQENSNDIDTVLQEFFADDDDLFLRSGSGNCLQKEQKNSQQGEITKCGSRSIKDFLSKEETKGGHQEQRKNGQESSSNMDRALQEFLADDDDIFSDICCSFPPGLS